MRSKLYFPSLNVYQDRWSMMLRRNNNNRLFTLSSGSLRHPPAPLTRHRLLVFPISFPTSLPLIDRPVKGLIPSHLDDQFLISLPHSDSTLRAEVYSCIQERRRGLLILTPWLVAMAGVLTARPSPPIDISPCLPSVFLHLSAPVKGTLCGKPHPFQTYIS